MKMELEEIAVQTLVDLGLTVLQAKAYLALCKLEESTARVIAKTAKIASQDVYRIITELEEKGLLERIVDSPNKYKATPLEESLAILLQQRTEKTTQLLKAKTKILKALRNKKLVASTNDKHEEAEFVILSSSPLNPAKVYDDVEESIDCISNVDRLVYLHLTLSEALAKAVTRGVKVRLITEKPANNKLFIETLRPFPNEIGFEARYINNTPLCSAAIFDHKRIAVDLNPIREPSKSNRLLTNHQAFIRVFQEYFEDKWSKARRYEISKNELQATNCLKRRPRMMEQ
jgi:sugar-specific transcriptional regulator TrmB